MPYIYLKMSLLLPSLAKHASHMVVIEEYHFDSTTLSLCVFIIGERITVRWTVRNFGVGVTSVDNWQDTIYLDNRATSGNYIRQLKHVLCSYVR